MWVVSGTAIALASRSLKARMDHRQAPMMGVLGALVFAAQMVNFAIPGTGSSGHFAGGLLLAILLGPQAAFLTLASILTVQALFFADGGLLALGANIFNMGFAPCFLVYPLIYRPLAGGQTGTGRTKLAVVLSAVLALQLGALGVVLETGASGIADLPVAAFLLAMQPIHLAIGLIEGLITLAVLDFILRADSTLLHAANKHGALGGRSALAMLAILAMLAGGAASWLASSNPDGLEWSIARLLGEGKEMAGGESETHRLAADLQGKSAILPGYAFMKPASDENAGNLAHPDAGTTLSGLVGGTITLAMAGLLGLVLRRRQTAGGASAR